jgi:hypothetical protein
MTRWLCVLGAVLLAITTAIGAFAQPPAWIVTPHEGKQIWVPATPALPALPAVPAAPARPTAAADDRTVIHLDAVPAELALVVNGQAVPPATRAVALPPGRHVLELTRQGAPVIRLAVDVPAPSSPASGYHVVPRP